MSVILYVDRVPFVCLDAKGAVLCWMRGGGVLKYADTESLWKS